MTPAPARSYALELTVAAVSVPALLLLGWILLWRQPSVAGHVDSMLPALNACWNTLSASALCVGFVAVKRGRGQVHRRAMLTAFFASAVFLVGYLAHHYLHGDTPYPRGLSSRTPYLILLASHVLTSIVAFPLILYTIALALRGRVVEHKRLARLTFPLWLYVSVTGVCVFLMLRAAYSNA